MLKGGRVFCDECGEEIQAIPEEEAVGDIIGHGWSNYLTANNHVCTSCSTKRWHQLYKQADPCGICNTEPCKRGGECWWSPPFSLWWPYETYYADVLEEKARFHPNQSTLVGVAL